MAEYRASSAVAATAEAAILMDSRACPSRECVADLYYAGRADSINEVLKREQRLFERPGQSLHR